MARTTGTLE